MEGPWKNAKTIGAPVGIRAGLSTLLDPSMAQWASSVQGEIQPLVVAGLIRDNIAAFALNLDHPDIIKVAEDLKDAKKTENAKKEIILATIMSITDVLHEARIAFTTAQTSFLFDRV